RGIIRLPGVAGQSGDGANVDDPSAALFDHRTDDGLAETEGTFQVGVQHNVPIVDRHSHAEAVASYASVVHQNIDATEVIQNARGGFLHAFVIGNIHRISFGGVGMCGIDFFGRAPRVRLTATHRRDPRAFVSQPDRDRVPYATP